LIDGVIGITPEILLYQLAIGGEKVLLAGTMLQGGTHPHKIGLLQNLVERDTTHNKKDQVMDLGETRNGIVGWKR